MTWIYVNRAIQEIHSVTTAWYECCNSVVKNRINLHKMYLQQERMLILLIISQLGRGKS